MTPSTVPDSFEAFRSSTDGTPLFTEWLRARSEPEWTAATAHPFTQDLADGTLPERVYADYLTQDYAFVDHLTSAFCYAAGQAPSVEATRQFIAFLETLTDEENDYFERSFAALTDADHQQDPELRAPTAAFIDLLGRASHEGGYPETLAVLLPAEWVYATWATAVEDGQAADLPFYYGEWIDLHANEAFLAFVDWLRGELDRVGPTLSPRRQRRVERLFCRTVTLEVAFFDAVSEGEH